MKNNSAIGKNWQEVRKELFSTDEIAESNLRVALITALIQARQEQGLSQKQLEELSGVKQPVSARMERGTSTPSVSTILKLLTPLGKKLAIVPLES